MRKNQFIYVFKLVNPNLYAGTGNMGILSLYLFDF